MVQELQQPSVPEEFYNLSQLAEMSAIAKKLCTTDVIQIKNYINKGDLTNNDLSVFDQDQQMLPISYDPCDYEKLYYEPTKKKWRNDWENCRKIGESLNSTPIHENQFAKFYLHDKGDFVINQNQEAINDKSICDSSNSYLLLSSSTSSISCSDDDSYKSVVSNYSHKIFDRKKQRTFTNSTDEEQSSNSDGDALNRRLQVGKHQVNFCDENLMDINNQTSDYDIHGPSDLTFTTIGLDNKAGAEDIHICPECGKKYSTSSNLARHRQTHRSLQDKKARRCQHCDKVYVSMPAFSMHQKTHQSGCQCPHCGKCFSRAWLLQGHLRTHTGEKPFQCLLDSCKKSFADKSNLRAHIQTHSNTKPFACSRCGKSFALKSYLYKHEESSCLKNHLKVESKKVRGKKLKKSESSVEAKPLESTHKMFLKNQHSLYVKEKIKEILEDGKKASKIHEDNAMLSHVENRISVIKSHSSASLEANRVNEYEKSVLKMEPELSISNFHPVGSITGSFTVVV